MYMDVITLGAEKYQLHDAHGSDPRCHEPVDENACKGSVREIPHCELQRKAHSVE